MGAHTMIAIETEFGGTIRKAAKRYSPRGTDPADTYVEILISVHDRVKAGRVNLHDRPAMNNTIRQRAIDLCRREVRTATRFVPAGDMTDDSVSPFLQDNPTRYATRVKELKTQIIRALDPIDAVIVCEMVFPSKSTRDYARTNPFRRSRRRGSNGSSHGVVRAWHVADLFGVTTARVTEAMNAARAKIDEIIQ